MPTRTVVQVSPPTTAPTPREIDERVADALRRAAESDARARELEARVAVIQAELRTLREQAARTIPRETIRIGAAARAARAAREEAIAYGDAPTAPGADAPSEGPIPVLRLYGEPRRAAATPAGGLSVISSRPSTSASIPVTPAGAPLDLGDIPLPTASDRLPVARLEGMPPPATGAGLGAPSAASPPARAADTATAEYRDALSLVGARRLDEALARFDQFLSAHPTHAYAESAAYWRGEVLYAKREYGRAMAAFEALVARSPRGAKTADALLKIAQCQQRMGRLEQARATLQRLRREFPDSDAARSASREVES